MLAQNFKTPAELDIPEEDFWALVKVLGMLEREEFCFDPCFTKRGLGFSPMPIGKETFFMGTLGKTNECGTIACIGGWVAIMTGKSDFDADEYVCNPPGKLYQLFWPGDTECQNGYIATPSQAAIALRNYLTDGEPRWAEALAASDTVTDSKQRAT